VAAISLVAIALTIADGSTYAERYDTPLSLNREIGALAVVNVISPFFGAYVAGAGLSRAALATSVAEGSNLTQMYVLGACARYLLSVGWMFWVRFCLLCA
jgi:MFS superfamily sulfate permease-like transporter